MDLFGLCRSPAILKRLSKRVRLSLLLNFTERFTQDPPEAPPISLFGGISSWEETRPAIQSMCNVSIFKYREIKGG